MNKSKLPYWFLDLSGYTPNLTTKTKFTQGIKLSESKQFLENVSVLLQYERIGYAASSCFRLGYVYYHLREKFDHDSFKYSIL